MTVASACTNKAFQGAPGDALTPPPSETGTEVADGSIAADDATVDPDASTMDATVGGDATTDPLDETPSVRDALAPDAATPGRDACVSIEVPASVSSLDLLVVLDRSGSMDEAPSTDAGTTGSQSKWTLITSALVTLVNSLPGDARVGLTFFPATHSPSTTAGYTTPAVPIAPLATDRAAILAALHDTSPNGGTPTACALPPSVQVAQAEMREGASVLLATDGQPTDECSDMPCTNPFDPDFATCEMNATANANQHLVDAASRGVAATPSVRTFVVGMAGSDDTALSRIARAGGTARTADCDTTSTCHYRADGANFQSELTSAFTAIGHLTPQCYFTVGPVDAWRIDPSGSVVTFTPASGAAPRTFPYDTSHTDGWDYSSDHLRVQIYGPSCDTVRTTATPSASFRLTVPCAS